MKNGRIAIFASGTGSNANALMEYFAAKATIEIGCLISNKEHCGALEFAKQHQVEARVFSNESIADGRSLLAYLVEKDINIIVLAGFLRKMPQNIIQSYPNKIINLHPALLPDFGGKGMYGTYVHEAVLEAKRKQSGITIHLVNENYDEGAYIAQFYTNVYETDSVSSLENRIRTLEARYFPFVVEGYIQSLIK